MCLAHEVAGCEGELQRLYHIAEARLHIYRERYDEAKTALAKAIALEYQVLCSNNAHTVSFYCHAQSYCCDIMCRRSECILCTIFPGL